MVRRGSPKFIEINEYEEFTAYTEKIKTKQETFFFFFGKRKDNGRSWCLYCQIAEPIVKNFLKDVKKKIVFAFVDVGDHDTWKNPQCPFRTDPRTKLMVIPTIIKWQGVQRLEGSQCSKPNLIALLFEDD